MVCETPHLPHRVPETVCIRSESLDCVLPLYGVAALPLCGQRFSIQVVGAYGKVVFETHLLGMAAVCLPPVSIMSWDT